VVSGIEYAFRLISSIFIMNPIYDLRRSASKYYAAADRQQSRL